MRRTATAAALALVLLSTLPVEAEGELFVTLPAAEFRGGDLTLFSFGGGSAQCDGYCEFVSSAELPHGARLLGIEIDGCRDAAADAPIDYFLLRRYPNDQAVADSKVEILAHGTVTATGCAYHQVAADSTKNLEVNSWSGEYLVAVVVGNLACGLPGTGPCPDGGTRFQAVRVYYEANSDGGTVEPTKPTGGAPLFP